MHLLSPFPSCIEVYLDHKDDSVFPRPFAGLYQPPFNAQHEKEKRGCYIDGIQLYLVQWG